MAQPTATPDALKVLDHALAFERSTYELEKLMSKQPDTTHTMSVRLSMWAFTYELFLKALYVARTGQRWPSKVMHFLDKIYDELDQPIKDEIVAAWIEHQKKNRGDYELALKLAGEDPKLVDARPLTAAGFYAELQLTSTAFQDWRYLFEAKDPSFGDILWTLPRIKAMTRTLIATGGKSFEPPT